MAIIKDMLRRIWKWLLAGVAVALIAAVVINWTWLCDYFRGLGYEPHSEMIRIEGALGLTERGKFLFRASRPVLSDRDEFNESCQPDSGVEVAVLGCYANGNIYVYNITDKELDGIRELTTAHELLHAVWARLSSDDKRTFGMELKGVFEANHELLKGEVANYNTEEQPEELYVRAGTEIKQLPDILEKHYAEIFVDQDKVVDYYNKYIAVFRALDEEMDTLMGEIEQLNGEIEAKLAIYNNSLTQLNARIGEFNSCAETMGCFDSQWEFEQRRNDLIAERANLEVLYEEINGMINSCNEKIDKYNQDVIYSEKLNSKINSTAKPVEVE